MNSQLDQGITAADLSPDDLLSEADQKEISDFLAVLNAPGWAVASSCKKDGLKVLWKKEADHPVVLVKAEIKVMVPAMTAFNFLDGRYQLVHRVGRLFGGVPAAVRTGCVRGAGTGVVP